MKNLNNYSRWAMSAFIVLIALLFFSTVEVKAQNVTISPNSGNLIAALTYPNEVGFQNGWSATWRHEQLPLTLNVADDPDLTDDGQLSNPAGNISKNLGHYVIMGGVSKDFYMAVTLPKGFKFTGYRLVLLNNVNGEKINKMDIASNDNTKTFYETDKFFNINDYKAVASYNGNINMSNNSSSNSNSNEYIIARTSMNGGDDMGNTLYFLMHHRDGQYFYGVTIKSFEIFFTAEGDFSENIVPTAVNSNAVSYIESKFTTSKLDLGPIEKRTKNGATFYSYLYTNVKDLEASLMLYQENAVRDGKPGDYATDKKITTARRNDNYYYVLKDDTYYIETPMEMKTQNNITLYQSYRIVGAKIHYNVGDRIIGTAGSGEKPSYKLTVFDKTGDVIVKEIIINKDENPSGTVEIDDLNNDAIKFKISDLKDVNNASSTIDYGAYLTFELTMQTLNPYINSLNIVCKEDGENGASIRQQFTSNDFAVRGGKFTYYIPENFKDPCVFTFEDLYSNYGDETYYGNSSIYHSRYSLVNSPYWENSSNLYEANPDHDYRDKIIAYIAGDRKFRFNNADELGNVGGPDATNYLREYPFSLNAYNTAGGSFVEIKLQSNQTKTAYLFTCDETRYNIAPTTALQHRYYAYYIMEVELIKKNYSPVFEWTKVYDEGETLYIDEDGKVSEKSQWGLKLLTTELIDSEQGKYGYLLVSQVSDEINRVCVEENTTGPKKREQILYIDGSELQSLPKNDVKDASTGEVVSYTLDVLRDGLAANSVIYLPYATATNGNLNNFATKENDGSFHGAANFVLQDQKPFYAPYDIQIDAANTCTYTRNVTIDKNGKVARASIILPFEISLDGNGNHVNKDSTIPFSVHQMKSEGCLSPTPVDGEENLSYVLFPSVTNVTKTEANTPYLIRVKKESYNSGDDKIIFVATQSGSLIKATTGMDNTEKYSFKGGESSGTFNGKNFSFTAYGSYAGKKLHIGHHYYYYSRDRFVCSDELDSWREYAKLTPFRTYYKGNGPLVSLLPAFGVIFGDGEGETDPTGIVNADEVPDLVISTGSGMLTMASSISQEVDIRNLNGILVNRISIGAGETLSVTLPAGIYIVNGTKLIVK